jgi:hypothetical protein
MNDDDDGDCRLAPDQVFCYIHMGIWDPGGYISIGLGVMPNSKEGEECHYVRVVLWAASTMGQANAGWTWQWPIVFYEQWPIGVGANLSSQRHQTKNQNIKPMLFSKSDGVVASLNPVHVNGVGGYYNTYSKVEAIKKRVGGTSILSASMPFSDWRREKGFLYHPDIDALLLFHLRLLWAASLLFLLFPPRYSI